MNAEGSPSSRRLSRRRLLRWGSAAALVAAAGCQGSDDPRGDNETDSSDQNSTDDEDNDNDDENNDNDNNDSENEYVEFDTELSSIVQLRGTVVARGDIDTAEIRGWATDASREGLVLEQTNEVGDHGIYEVVSDEDVAATVAVSEESLVIGGSRDRTEAVIRTALGDGERGTDTYEEYSWLLSAVGDGEFVYGGYIPESERSGESGDGPRRSANGYAVSMETEDGETSVRFAATYPDLTEQLQSEIRGQIGADAAERAIGFDGNRAFVEATYPQDLVAAIAEAQGEVRFGVNSTPEDSDATVPAEGSLPRVASYIGVQGGVASGSSIDEGPFRTIEDGFLDRLASQDPLLREPIRRSVNLHNNLGRVLLGNFPYLFRIVFDIDEVSGQQNA